MNDIEYYSLLSKYNNQCCICGSNKNLCIDHCHITNHIRGILCRSCNLALGKFGDSSESLNKAYLYLKNFEQLLTLIKD